MRVPCPKCKGTGTVNMRPELAATLAMLKRHRKGASAVQLWRQAGDEQIGVTAWNRRLEDLRDLNLVRRERAGKQYLYFCL